MVLCETKDTFKKQTHVILVGVTIQY